MANEFVNDIRRRFGYPPLNPDGSDPRKISKLNHAQRCEIAALAMRGVDPEELAHIFGVHKRTVNQIMASANSPTQPHLYTRVWWEVRNYNTVDEFCFEFITEEKAKAVREFEPNFRWP